MKLKRYLKGDRETLKNFKRLYVAAFPKEERKPFKIISSMHKSGRADMLKIESPEGEFLGLAFTVIGEKLVLLDYFAIEEKKRCQGFGEKALALIKERYPDKPILIEIEDPDEPSENKAERARRLAFYERCGMEINSYKITLFGVKMIMLSYGGPVPFQDYKSLYSSILPRKIVDKNVTLR